MRLLVGTDDGLFEMADGIPARLRSGRVSHLAAGEDADFAIIDDGAGRLVGGQWQAIDWPVAHAPRSLLPAQERLFVGTAGARLYVVRDGAAELVDGFAQAEGRETWHTPWGGPPDTRSLARTVDGVLYANVHVGGVLRSKDGRSWQPTMDIAADVHQVAAHPALAGCALVASAWGFGLTLDGAAAWAFTAAGLHSAYCRAVVAADDVVLISAADGPRGGRAAIYRRELRSGEPFEQCRDGLPEWFEGNIDSGCLVGSGRDVAFGTADGEVFVSADAGLGWTRAASGLPAIRALAAPKGAIGSRA